ncbi:MAG: LytTR family transcriptional regulator DNA-binding domain-containing protein [Paludibacteraceae bacterium]|jgi:DNA-binding LytR/AlgR family response regulator|nr:LytTR family transcriptional regulator DNA-binding domain-containing protein [Paludibacteraceae bacterium]
MPKIVLNTRDELIILKLENVAYVKADGNYIEVVYINNHKLTLLLSFSKFQEMVRGVYPPSKCPFSKVGRSLLVNNAYLERVSIQKEKLILSDFQDCRFAITLNKNALKIYKNAIMKTRL